MIFWMSKILLFIVLCVPLVHEARGQESGDIVIIFDQSGSVQKYDSKQVSKVWLMTFVETFGSMDRIIVAGFDEKIHEHVNTRLVASGDIRSLSHALDVIQSKGLATDMELPFRYLAERGRNEHVRMAFLISDGEPEVWDRKLGYLSRQILADTRYQDINKQYRTLRAKGVAKDDLYERLGPLYRKRNLELTKERVDEVAQVLGDRLMIWDLSGRSEYLQSWALQSGAQYLAMSLEDGKSPIAAFRNALTTLQRAVSRTVNQPLPTDYQTRAEAALAMVPEAELVIAREARMEAEARLKTEVTAREHAEQLAYDEAMTREKAEAERDLLITLLVIAGLLTGGVTIWALKRRSPMPVKPEPIPEADVSEDDEQEPADTPEIINVPFPDNKRLALRVTVPRGSIIVHWLDRHSTQHRGKVIDVSNVGVKFESMQHEVDEITSIVCPKLNITLNINHAVLIRQERGRTVYVIKEFDDNDLSWNKWRQLPSIVS